MKLPYDNNSQKRKYQCFVCGVAFLDFEEYKSHIIQNHEEGTDYVKCPLARCQAPVRDVRVHFKAIHPSETLPKQGMLKATLWRDITADGKAKKKKPKCREGYYQSTKMGKAFFYRSGWEATVFECLDSWNEVLAYEVEPFEIPYIHKGESHKYIPDVFVMFLDGRKEVWEIKPSSQTHLQMNQDKWYSAKIACEARGWNFEVIVEQRIEKLKKIIKEQYLN